MIRFSEISFVFILLFIAKIGLAQDNSIDSDIKYYLAMNMHPKDFDNWMDNRYLDITNRKKVDTDSIESIVISRSKIGMLTFDNAVFKGLKLISYFEVVIAKTNDYAKSIKFIDNVVNSLYGQELLKIKLLKMKGNLLKNTNAFDEKIYNDSKKSYEESLSLLTPLTLELSLMKNEVNMEIGNILSQGFRDKESAEKYFIKVQRFPFWLVQNGDYFFKFRQLYINAGFRRLEINRGNLKKLYTLAFVPATGDKLYPLWRTYIEEVGGNWEDIEE